MDWITGAGKWGVADAGRVNFLIKPCSDKKTQRQTKSSRIRPNKAEVTKATQLGRERRVHKGDVSFKMYRCY